MALISSIAVGLPTMSLRPTTTASCPATGIRLRLRISITPAGVQGTKSRALRREKADVDGMEAVHIFRGIDGHQYLFGINLSGQRQLHQDAVDFLPAVERVDEREQFFGGRGFGTIVLLAVQSNFVRSFDLAAHIDFRRRIMSD